MTKPWQICLVLVVIFAAGGVGGGLVPSPPGGPTAAPPPPPPDVWVARDIERAGRVLELTAEQRERIKPVVKNAIEELNQLRRPYLRSAHEILMKMEGDIGAILTPEQKVKYQNLLQRQREVWRQVQEQRGMRGNRDRPPGPPPPEGGAPALPKPGTESTGT